MSVVLRVVDRRNGEGHRVVVSLEAPGVRPPECAATVTVSVDAADAERVRWYLEDYAEFPSDPAPRMARAEKSWMTILRLSDLTLFPVRLRSHSWPGQVFYNNLTQPEGCAFKGDSCG